MEHERKVMALGMDSLAAAEYHMAIIKQLRGALDFAEKQIKSGKGWDAKCEKIISEALHPTKLPEGIEIYGLED